MSRAAASDANALLQLAAGVRLQPAISFPPDILDRLGGEPGDVVLSQHRSRYGAQRISADAAALLERFATPKRIAEALVEFARDRGEDPETLLPRALPLIKRLRAQRLLLPPEDIRPAAVASRFLPGARMAVGVSTPFMIEAVVSADTETEIYRVRLADGGSGALKWVPATAPEFVRASLAREVEALVALEKAGFADAPRLIAAGQEAAGDERADCAHMLLLEWVEGVDGYRLARDPSLDLLTRARLAADIVASYARLHRLGWLHGDVHPGNLLCHSDRPRLIDFGGAIRAADPTPPPRAGLLTDYEPEAARALLAGQPLPPPSPAGEQYAVAALALRLISGAPAHRLPLESQSALAILASVPARTLADSGVEWPDLDAILTRALALDPDARFADMDAFASALDRAVQRGRAPVRATAPSEPADDPLAALLALAGPDGALARQGVSRGPRASIYHGAAGLAFACLAAAEATDSADLLAAADHWAEAAIGALGDPAAGLAPDPRAFDARDLGVPEGEIDPASFFHGAAGVHAVRARVRGAFADVHGACEAVEQSIAALGPVPDRWAGPRGALDLLNGLASQLAGLAFLAEGTADASLRARIGAVAAPRMKRLARALADWFDQPVDRLPAEARYLGLAHGSAGALFALLRADRILSLPDGDAVDLAGLADRQARFALWSGERAAFPVEREGQAGWAGWCHGTAGHLLLWISLAARVDRPADHRMVEALALDLAARLEEGGPTLCCGAAGMVFALQALHAQRPGRADRERPALIRLLEPTNRVRPDLLVPHSLWRGYPGIHLARLALHIPNSVSMPFFG